MTLVIGAMARASGVALEEFAYMTGCSRNSMRGLPVRDPKPSGTKFLLALCLWIPFLLLSLLVQSPPVSGGCEAPDAGSCPETDHDPDEAAARPEPGARYRHPHQRIMDPELIGAVSGHFRSIFGEQTAAADVYLARDFLLIRTGGLLGAAEQRLLETGTDGDADFIRAIKLKLAENNLASLASDIARSTGLSFTDTYLTYSPAEDEMMVMLTLPGGRGG